MSAPPSANDRIIKKPGSYKTKCAGISHRIAKLKIFAKLVSKTSTVGAKKAARLFCQVRQAYEFAKTVSVRPMAAATTIKTTSDTVEVKRRKPDSKNIGQAFFFLPTSTKKEVFKRHIFLRRLRTIQIDYIHHQGDGTSIQTLTQRVNKVESNLLTSPNLGEYFTP